MAQVNNSIYQTLGERWYTAQDDPIALLRAQARLLAPWILGSLGTRKARILDVGCGAGFYANYFAKHGHQVVGIDLGPEVLAIAREHDTTTSVVYQVADARSLPFADGEFDLVIAMDFLEHVRPFDPVISECSRVLKDGGDFFFHTFNRNPVSWLVAIKLVEWLVVNTPKDLHLWDWFIKPSELQDSCDRHGLSTLERKGTRPRPSTLTLETLLKGEVPAGFAFEFSSSLLVGYTGRARKLGRTDSRRNVAQ